MNAAIRPASTGIARRIPRPAAGLAVLALGAALVLPGPAHAQKSARERAKAEMAAEAAREQELVANGLPEEIALCQARIERLIKRNRQWEAFRWSEASAEVTSSRATGKFTPRFPVDVQRIAKLPGELRRKRKAADAPEEWVTAEAWCGIVDEKLVAVDVFGPGEKR